MTRNSNILARHQCIPSCNEYKEEKMECTGAQYEYCYKECLSSERPTASND